MVGGTKEERNSQTFTCKNDNPKWCQRQVYARPRAEPRVHSRPKWLVVCFLTQHPPLPQRSSGLGEARHHSPERSRGWDGELAFE